MKKDEKKLPLGKVTVQDLDSDEQKAVKGGTNTGQTGVTEIPIC